MRTPCFRLLLALTLASTAPAAEAPAPPEIAEISRRVQEIRGLEFKEPVPVEVVGQDAARAYAERRLARFTSPAALAAEDHLYHVLGLLPASISLGEAYLDAVMGAAAGFYDPERKEFFLLDDLRGAAGSIFAAHELTHALEDQHYDLDARIEASMEDADLAFAGMALHEGSASLVMTIYTERALAEGWLQRTDLEALATSDAARGEKVAALPPLLRRQLLGAYVLGMGFLLRGQPAQREIEFPREDAERCFRDGPRSSEQILHPEKFWDPARRDPPRRVELRASPVLAAEGFTLGGEGTLGELLLGPLVGAPTPRTWAPSALAAREWTNEAASGWGGDRWQLWTRGSDAVVVLATVWDTQSDAREFADALPRRDDLRWKRSGGVVALVAGLRDERLARRVLRSVR